MIPKELLSTDVLGKYLKPISIPEIDIMFKRERKPQMMAGIVFPLKYFMAMKKIAMRHGAKFHIRPQDNKTGESSLYRRKLGIIHLVCPNEKCGGVEKGNFLPFHIAIIDFCHELSHHLQQLAARKLKLKQPEKVYFKEGLEYERTADKFSFIMAQKYFKNVFKSHRLMILKEEFDGYKKETSMLDLYEYLSSKNSLRDEKMPGIIAKIKESQKEDKPSTAITKEMLDRYYERTLKHIELVKKALYVIKDHAYELKLDPTLLIIKAENHDQSKFNSDEREGYIWITEFYHHKNKGKGKGKDYKYPNQEIKDMSYNCSGQHVMNNAHHPEYHKHTHNMRKEDIAEHVADMAAMSQELGEPVDKYFYSTNVKKFKYTTSQMILMKKMFKILKDEGY